MTRLVLVRHGQAFCNVDRTIEGLATCRGLSDLGRRQSEALAFRLHSERFEPAVVVTSPILRARQTAEILCGILGVQATSEPAFEEIRPGDADGMSWDQYTAFFGNSDGWDPNVPFAPNAESWAIFANRVSKAFDAVTESNEGHTILVITHGGVVDASLFHYFGFDPAVQSPIDFETTNCSLTEWQRRTFRLPNDDELRRWRLVRYNDAAHLAAVV